MKDNFVNIVQTQLDKDEIILKNFYSPNIEMIHEGIEAGALSNATLMGTKDYSFRYNIIITNRRVFIADITPSFEVHSYKVYNKTEFRDVNLTTYKDNRKVSFLNFYYIGGLLPIILVIGSILNSTFTKGTSGISVLFILILSYGLPIMICYLCIRLFKTLINTKQVAEIILNDNKVIKIILDKKSTLNLLKA